MKKWQITSTTSEQDLQRPSRDDYEADSEEPLEPEEPKKLCQRCGAVMGWDETASTCGCDEYDYQW